jgi:hypothetical protein
VANGRLTEGRGVSDMLAVLRQLGVVEATPAASTG